MGHPWPNPPQVPPTGPGQQPTSGTFTVQLKPCCGQLPGDLCGCPELAADIAAAFRPRDLARGNLGPITVRFGGAA